MNSSNLKNYTVSFMDLSRIMKNLRNAFIYTASTQQRNGNFQQWLPYNALCLGKATPSHCILETMRPRAWARSSSHHRPGRSLPAALPLPAVPRPPGGLSMYSPSHEGAIPSQSSPWMLGEQDRAPRGGQAPPGCLLGGMHWRIPSGTGRCGTPSTHRNYMALHRALYLGAFCGAGGEEAARLPALLAQDRLQAELGGATNQAGSHPRGTSVHAGLQRCQPSLRGRGAFAVVYVN